MPVVDGTVTPGVKIKTGETDDPTPLDMKAMEPKKAAATMAGATFCWVPASAEVSNKNIPAARALPRVRPDSVTVMAVPVPVGAVELRVRVIAVLEEVAADATAPITVAATVAVPVK